MRILFLNALYAPHVGGIEVLLTSMVNELEGRGTSTLVLSSCTPSDVPGPHTVDGRRALRVDAHASVEARDAKAILGVQRDIKRAVQDFQPDVVHSHDIGPVMWLYQHVAPDHDAPPLLLTVHSVLEERVTRSRPALERIMAATDRITAVSQQAANEVVDFAPVTAGRVSVIPNGIVPPDRPVVAPPADGPRLLVLGRLIETKRVELAVDAMARLAPRHPGLRLTIAGSGPVHASLAAQVRAHGLGDRVDFLGAVPHERVFDVIDTATVVVMTSSYEGNPLVALETAWRARPVVCTGVAGLDEAVIDGETGIVVPENDPAALDAALETLIEHPELAAALGAGARDRAEHESSISVCVDRYERVYREMLAAQPLGSVRT